MGHHRLSRFWWEHYVRQRWFVAVSHRSARLRAGVVAWLEEGQLRLRDTLTRIEVSIPSSWRMVERAAMYDIRGARLSPEQYQREIQSQYQVRE